METWLVLPGRLLPLTNFDLPLVRTQGTAGANYFAAAPFRSSRPQRVMLVLADPYARPEAAAEQAAIRNRFAPPDRWQRVIDDPEDRVAVWTATLKEN
jgi:hypothetical protein